MIDWPDAVKQGSLIAGGANVVLLGVLLATRRWWRLDDPGGRRAVDQGASQKNSGDASNAADGDTVPASPSATAVVSTTVVRRYFWLLLAGVLCLAAVFRVPLARSSLWWDEVWQARNASVGEFRPDKKRPGELKFRETTFAQAMWNYRKPANHPPMAVASKACHEVWRGVTGAKPGEFREWVLRLPGFAASLAGLGLLALMMRAWGFPGAGLVAALVLAVHPWHIRYGIDNRGYTFLVPLTVVGLWSLWRACGPAARGAWEAIGSRSSPASAWWVFGVTQALVLWSHLLSVWVCLSLCATGVWWIWRGYAGVDRWRRLARLVAVQVAGAMVFLALFLPNLLQALQWGEKNQDGRLLDGVVFLDTVAQVAAGTAGWGWVGPVWVLAVAAAGVLAAVRLKVPGTAGIVLLTAGAGLFLAWVWASGFYFYPRFLFAVVVPMAAAIGLGVTALGSRPQWGTKAAASLVLLGVAAGEAAPGTEGGLKPVTTVGFSPLREAAQELRAAESSGALVFGYGFGAEALQYYLPTLPYAREADAPEALAAAVERARAAGKPLHVVTGYETLNRLSLPEGFKLLDDASKSKVVWQRDGLEPQFAYRIRRIE